MQFRLFHAVAALAIGLAPWALAAQAPPAPPPAAPAVPSAAPPLSLAGLVREALARNPEVQAARQHVAALRAAVPQATALPDPTVSVGWIGRPLPLAVDGAFPPSFRSIAAAERFPFPGKLKLRGRIADRNLQAAMADLDATRRRVASGVKVAYDQYAFVNQALGIVQSTRTLLVQLTRIATARYQAGQGLQQDVLKGQLAESQLLARITILQQRRQLAVAQINALLHRDPEVPLAPPAPLVQTRLTFSLDQLYRLARANDTGLARDQRVIERDQAAVDLAHKAYDPDFTVSYMYQQRPNLMDTQGATVTVNIPIFFRSKQRQQVKQAVQTLAADRSLRAGRQAAVAEMVKQQLLAAQQADKLAQLYAQAIVPQSSETLAAAELAYQSGKADFLTMLDGFINTLDFQVGYAQQIANYQTALARLEPLVGVDLTH